MTLMPRRKVTRALAILPLRMSNTMCPRLQGRRGAPSIRPSTESVARHTSFGVRCAACATVRPTSLAGSNGRADTGAALLVPTTGLVGGALARCAPPGVQAARLSPATESKTTRTARSEPVLMVMISGWHYSVRGAPRRLVRRGGCLGRESVERSDSVSRLAPAVSERQSFLIPLLGGRGEPGICR